MALYLEVVEGDNLGAKFKIFPGVRIGRSAADIILDDPRVSGLHAQVEKNAKEQLVLLDKNSSNGLWINFRRVKRVTMLPGVTFSVGKSVFKVIDHIPGVQPGMLKGGAYSWQLVLLEAIHSLTLVDQVADLNKAALQPFHRPLQLKFILGLQAGREILIGFGPRLFGKSQADFMVQEPGLGDVFFSIEPLEDGALLKDNSLGQVKINKRVMSQCFLKNGDEVSLGNTVIKIQYL